ncbi:uncharacterized protein LOC109601510 [Aethina tumida]|uniref:uncharacterized protein LOC109601510 n=1 Tax=Aethina tumida TaxID=116153 RepID=UPI0021494DC4|nr:uncharacterized protein LOC109601510 [Aethina tumida]
MWSALWWQGASRRSADAHAGNRRRRGGKLLCTCRGRRPTSAAVYQTPPRKTKLRPAPGGGLCLWEQVLGSCDLKQVHRPGLKDASPLSRRLTRSPPLPWRSNTQVRGTVEGLKTYTLKFTPRSATAAP